MIVRGLQSLLAETRSGLVALYGVRLCGFFLFGSHARGDADSESDVDLLVVLDRIDRYGEEIERTSEFISSVSLKYGISLSRVFVTEHDWRSLDTPFLANVREEAVAA